MRHRQAKFALNRFTSWRKATLKSMAASLFLYQRIKTTKAKAKALRPVAEKLISLARQNTLSAKRRAYAALSDHKLVNLLFNDIGPRFNNRIGGYTRILNLGTRRGDNAQMVVLELTEIKKEPKRPKKQKEQKISAAEEKRHGSSEKPSMQEQPKTSTGVKEMPAKEKKPPRKFFGGFKNIFKKERDSL